MRRFGWEPAAQIAPRRIGREDALRILYALTKFGAADRGDVQELAGQEGAYRLRVGKYRVFFDLDTPGVIHIVGVDNRGQAY